MTAEAQGAPDSPLEELSYGSRATDANKTVYLASNRHQGEDADGLGGFRGLRSAVILEALAVGAAWLAWNLGAWVAAWWRAL